MKHLIACTLAATALVATSASAQTATVKSSERKGVLTTTEQLKNGKNVEKITCKSFNALDESFKPQAVAYAVDYTAKGKPKDPMVDVAGTERITPMVVTDCNAHPELSLMSRVKAAFHHH